MAGKKNETVSVSFHYLTREINNENGEVDIRPFLQDEFESLVETIQTKPEVDITDEKTKDRLRFRTEVPFDYPKRIDKRTFFGRFFASYWGHAYKNSDRGKIPADSVSVRPFYFMLYLSDTGRIYIASQYLGQFGGYMALLGAVREMLPEFKTVVSHSFRLGARDYTGAEPKEVKVSLSKKSESIASGNVFSQNSAVVFKKSEKNDGFESEVTKKLFPFIGREPASVRKAVASLLKESDLMDVKEEDIQDCVIFAILNGKRSPIHLLEGSNFASRFPIGVPINIDGHPKPEPTQKEMFRILKEEIVSRKEDV